MPLLFSCVCDLLERSYKQCAQKQSNKAVVTDWFARNRHQIDSHDTDLSALLSTILPERRTDRVFCIKSPRLEKIIGRALCLGRSRMHELSLYKQPGSGADLGDCLERILRATVRLRFQPVDSETDMNNNKPTPVAKHLQDVTVEEIDMLLHGLAAGIRWSSPAIRASQATPNGAGRDSLEAMYLRLESREAKWFTRLVLKSYEPLIFDAQQIYSLCSPSLPMLLRIQEDFLSAVTLIQKHRGTLLPNQDRRSSALTSLLATVKPKLGVKVGRQNWFKARSIKHCIDMAGSRAVNIEKKIDGEYCQIHVDPTKGIKGIQIFSKSGKDSTEDREGLLCIISESLRLNTPECKIQKQCIIEGELAVYSDLKHQIQPFHKIRQFVSRRGRFMNTEQDSRPSPYDHLMIVYYDLLLLDDHSFLDTRQSERFAHLQGLIRCRPGFAELVQHQRVDLGSSLGAHHLRKAFAEAIVAKEEGLVVKPDTPYFNFHDSRERAAGLCIKLKKEYIGTFGDVGDFAVVGAGYDAVKAKSYPDVNVKWTRFYIGCLMNRDEVKQWDDTPYFKIVNFVDLNEAQMKLFVSHGNPQAVALEANTATRYELAPGVLAQSGVRMTHAFQSPPVFDIRCFSFDNVGNTDFWSMRFPTVSKIHFDRDYTGGITFEGLQQLALDARQREDLEDSQENLRWIANLEAADPRGRGVDAVSQVTATTAPTPSPRRSTQTTSESPLSPIQRRIFNPGLGDSTLLRLENRLSLPAPVPLLTLPTSSDTAAASAYKQSQSTGKDTCKRQQIPEIGSPSYKRQKGDRRSQTSSKETESSPLQILQDTILNTRSQPNMDLNQDELQENEIAIELRNASNDTPLATPSHNMASSTNVAPEPERSICSQAPEDHCLQGTGAIHIVAMNRVEPGLDAKDNSQIVTLARSRAGPIITIDTAPGEKAGKSSAMVQQEEINTRPVVCKHVGSSCRFGQYQVVVAPFLIPLSERLEGLCEEHGLNPITDANGWFQGERTRFRDGRRRQERGRILLVDTLQKPEESRRYISRISESRASHELRSAWVLVFDWRVLEAWSIRENPDLNDANRERFDAYRRFQVGII